MSEFFVLHRDLPREGPGEPGDVQWALDEGGLHGVRRVLDAACGPGADLETLADLLPEARIDAVDRQAHFVAAARARVAPHGDRIVVRERDMADVTGPYDLIWCAGAVYFLGVTEALTGWRAALAPGGHVCFSEPVWRTTEPPEEARAFWRDYPAITDLAGIVERVKSAGYRVVSARYLQPSAWAAYYLPLSARIEKLRPGASPELLRVLDNAAKEIAQWRAAPMDVTYAQLLVAPK